MPVSNVQTQALATVLHRAIIQARLLVYRVASETQEESSRRTLQQIAALMDAIHNVPQGLLATEGPDVANLLRDFQVYDEDFADGREVPSLWGPTALLAAVGWSERHVSRHQANSYAESNVSIDLTTLGVPKLSGCYRLQSKQRSTLETYCR